MGNLRFLLIPLIAFEHACCKAYIYSVRLGPYLRICSDHFSPIDNQSIIHESFRRPRQTAVQRDGIIAGGDNPQLRRRKAYCALRSSSEAIR